MEEGSGKREKWRVENTTELSGISELRAAFSRRRWLLDFSRKGRAAANRGVLCEPAFYFFHFLPLFPFFHFGPAPLTSIKN